MATIFGDRIEVLVDGVTTVFNDPVAMPSGIVSWGIDTLLGWDETSELDVVSTPIGGGADGEIVSDFFSARARHMIIGGWVFADSRESADAAWDLIARAAFPRNKDIVLTRFEPTPKFVTLRVSDRREKSPAFPYGFRWNCPVMAPSPFKFDPNPVSGGPVGVAGQSSGGRFYPRTYPLTYTVTTSGSENSFTLVNAGTANAYGVFTIHGPLVKGGWRLVNDTTGEYIRFDVALSASDVLTIDFANRVALLNGYAVTASISGDFWPVVPGANVIRLFGDYDPAVSVSGTIYSAWE